jgi:23S rRNA (uracil1939-C5)-methyltransferase
VPSNEHCCADDPATVVLAIASLSHGPHAVARHGGRVVFVPGVAPGDRVRVRLVEERGSYVRAEVVHRCAPGPAYREPPCPWVAACGGCPWQQVAYPAQLEAKARNVRDLLRRIARVAATRELPIIGAPHEWGYRHRIRLHVGSGGEFGYMEPRSHRIVEIDACTVADPLLSALLAPLRRLLPALATRLRSLELLTNGRGGVVVLATADDRFCEADADTIVRFLHDDTRVAAVQLAGRGWKRSFGDPTIMVVPDPAAPRIRQRPGSFTQVNAEANRLLVQTVVALAAPATRVLDLFCGAGNLSLPLAHAGARVRGVDRDRDAIADAAASAAAAGLSEVRFEASAADRFLRQQGLAGADLIVLDPPRTGAATVAAQLARLRPPRILYVSCDPATLARDVGTLAAAGYIVDRMQPIDLFPQTEHVETVLEAVQR